MLICGHIFLKTFCTASFYVGYCTASQFFRKEVSLCNSISICAVDMLEDLDYNYILQVLGLINSWLFLLISKARCLLSPSRHMVNKIPTRINFNIVPYMLLATPI